MNEPLTHIAGRVLESVDPHEPGQELIFRFSGGIQLNVGAPWRLVTDGEICLGSEDHAQPFGLSTPLDAHKRLREFAVGKHVEAASANSRGDLTIRLDGEVAIEIFNASCGYEGWAMRGPGSKWVVAQGGGRVVDSEADA